MTEFAACFWLDGVDTLASIIAAEIRRDQLGRAEVIELCQLAWRQLEPGSVLPIGAGESVGELLRHAEKHGGVIEALCAQESPRSRYWMEWLATVVACLVLLWESDPTGGMSHSHALRMFGREWTF